MKNLYLILLLAFVSQKTFAQAPANDNCSGAIELTVNANNLCGTSTLGSTIDATLSQSGCNFSSSADDDVWYKFTATANIHKIEVTPITLKNAVFEVLSGTCGSLTSLACVDNTFQDAGVEKTTLSGLTIGQVYFIRVHSAGNFSSVRGTFSICVGVPVPPTNDNCATPTAITINEDQTCTLSTAGNSEDATESLAGCYAGSNADDDVWFSFTATQAAHFIKMTNETIQSPILEIFKGSCGSLVSIYCDIQYNNNTGFKIGELVPGQTYLIRVYSYYGPGQAGSFSLCINEPTGMPANDACSGALALTANTSSCSTVTAADLENATGAYDATCVGDKIKDDVWFKFTATDTEMILKMLNHSISSPQMELFSGTCGTLSQVLCADYGFMAVSNLTIGQEYYLRVWSRYGVSAGNGGFDMCLSTTALNDDISEAITLQVNNDYTCTLNNTGDNLFAVSDLPVSNSYGYCAPLINGAWYKFTALNDSLEISLTPQSNSGPTMEVFHMVSGNPVFLDFSDQKVILTDAVLGDEYYILVYNCTTYPLSRGTYDICIKNIPPPPANDNCASAIALTVNNDLTCSITTEGTTQNALGEPYGCSGSPDDDVWYSFVATATEHQITVTPGTMDDPAFVVYEGSCGALNELLCENNSCCGNPEVNKVTGLTIGDTYYVQVYSSSLYSDQGTFSICVNLPIPVPTNAECTNAEVITVGSSCVPTSGTNIGVENSTYDNCDFYKYMVWYEFTATTSTQLIHITKGSIANFRLDVFENNCNSLSRVSNCDYSEYNADHDFVVSGFTVNSNYLIAVSTTNQSDAGTFDICLSEIQTPANDECSGAIALTVNASSSPTVRTEGTTQFATESQAACSGNAKDDVWFSFIATQASHRLFFKTINFSGSPVLEVFSGTCGSLVSQQCITPASYNSDNSFTLLTGLNPSQTYFVRVHNSIGVSYGGTFSVGIASLVAPANDECIGAINIQTATDFSQNVSGNTLDATLSQASCISGPYADDDVWYKFTATQTVHLIKVQGMSNNSGRIEVYSGSCGALTLLDCGNPSISGDTILKEQIGLQVNSTYFFRIYTSTFSPSFTTFKVAVTNPYISPYDECQGALTVSVSNDETCTPTAFSFEGAYKSSLSLNCGASVAQNDVFLKFTASSTQHQIKISPASYLTGQLYAGTCGSQTLMACNAFGYDSLLNIGGLSPGQEYTLRLLQNFNTTPPLQICISTPNYASNDEITGAENIPISGNQLSCEMYSDNLDSSSQSIFSICNVPPNNGDGVTYDKWYKFTATAASHRLFFLNNGAQIPSYEIFSGSASSLNYISCSSYVSSSKSEILENLTPGQTYFIRVYCNYTKNADFQICISNVIVPANDLCENAQSLTVYQTWLTSNYTSGSTIGATRTIESNSCGAANTYDVWYKFTATQTSHFIGFRDGILGQTTAGLTVAVYSGAYNARTHITCKTASFSNQNDEKLQVNALTIGQEYFIKVYSSTASTSTQGNFSIQVLDLTVPSNDDCATPKPLSIQSGLDNFTYTTDVNLLATTSSQTINCSVGGIADDDLWYSFTPNSSNVRLLLNSDFKNLAYVIYSGSCSTLSPIICGSTGTTAFTLNQIIDNLVPSTEYKIRLYSFSSTQRGRVFIALTSDVQAPVNDSCQNAIDLVPSIDNLPNFTSGTNLNARSTNTQCFTGEEVWYKFTATAAEHRIIYDGYLKDPAITGFSGSCNNLSILPNACFGGVHSIAFNNTGLTIGQTYYFKVASQTKAYATQGNFKIAVTNSLIPANDNCVDALSLSNIPTYYTTQKATNEFSLSTECGNFGNDVWFKFTATKAKMSISIENLNSDAMLGVYKGACPSPTLIKCSRPSGSTQKINVLNLDTLTVGEEYLVNISALVSSAKIEFRISAFENQAIEENTAADLACLGINMVSNPSFEDAEICPGSFSGTPSSPGQWLSHNLGWTIPSMGSADYLNACADYNASIEIPRNPAFGYQTPRNGIAYAGFFVGGSTYREYLHTTLTAPMEIGKKYVLSMYVSRADYYKKASNNIGFGLSEANIVQHSYETLVVDKILLPTQNLVLHEKDEWVNISVKFTADKAYKHLYLGNFKGEPFTITETAVDISGAAPGGYFGLAETSNAYYFVDDIMVAEVANTLACGTSPCDNALTLHSPTDDINSAIDTQSSNLEIKANIIIQGSSNVLYTSGKYILMDAQNGVFEVKNGAVFEAKIGGCEN